MERIAIVSRDTAACARFKELVSHYGFSYDEKAPELVISFGGDGTLLHAERLFPGVPKLLLRGSTTCQKCHNHPLEHALDALREGRFTKRKMIKLEVELSCGTKISSRVALNDIILRNKHLEHAIRFSLSVDGKQIHEQLIGDGLVVATPYGSTAYFKSITKETFKKGMGLAFNNITLDQSPLLLDDSVEIRIRILRGPAEVAADNDRFPAVLEEGDVLLVRKSSESTTILELEKP